MRNAKTRRLGCRKGLLCVTHRSTPKRFLLAGEGWSDGRASSSFSNGSAMDSMPDILRSPVLVPLLMKVLFVASQNSHKANARTAVVDHRGQDKTTITRIANRPFKDFPYLSRPACRIVDSSQRQVTRSTNFPPAGHYTFPRRPLCALLL